MYFPFLIGAVKWILAELDLYRDDATGDCWGGAESVCWGEVKQRAEIVSRKPDESGRFDDIIDYGLVDRNHPSPAAPTP